MDNCCTPQCKAMKMIVLGIVLILVRQFTIWDIWIVIGVIVIILGIKKLMMPVCPCNSDIKSNSDIKKRK